MFSNFRSAMDNGWSLFIDCNCGAVGIVFVLVCELSYVFGVVDSFVLYSFI